ncbi:MAG: amino acid permease [Aeriscardovia sp.]|nr:amino acid permease [Aeriscardovia sp.]
MDHVSSVPSASSYPTVTETNNKKQYMSMFALAMMNVSMIAGLANDPQQAFYGLSSITFFFIGSIFFFIPTALVCAEMATGWSQRGGIFRWVGEAMGKGWAFTCLIILWMQSSIAMAMSIPSFSATILFYTPDFGKAVAFAENSSAFIGEGGLLAIMTGWVVFFWIMCWMSTRGVKAFSKIAKYGVFIGTLIPLALMVILAIVWVAEGHHSAISYAPSNLIPQWNGISTLSLAAGVFFCYAGIDMNAAHIKDLKDPKKEFPKAILISMILCLLIFIIGTLVIATVIPENQLNVLYALFATFRALGAAIGMPWLYMVITWALLCNTFASLVTQFSGPSFMLGQAARAGFLPKWLQSYNKYGMPSKLMYIQCGFMTIFAYLVELLPNVEGFVILLTQAITVIYLVYYMIFFTAYLRLKYTQPNRPRSFTIPGGKVGGWITCIIGYIACLFGIVLAVWPPAQVAKEVGSPVTYVVTILSIDVFILVVGFILYACAKHANKNEATSWIDQNNEFMPFTWEIEGFDKPTKSLSNIPSEILAYDQNPMSTPVKHHFSPDARLEDIPQEIIEGAQANN